MSDRMPVPVERRGLAIGQAEPAYIAEAPETPQGSLSFLAVLARRWKLAAGVAAGAFALGMAIIWTAVRPEYAATAAIKVDPVIQAIVFDEESKTLPFYSQYVSTQANLISSPRILYPVLEDPQVRNLAYVKSFAEPLEELQKLLVATADRNSQLIRVTVTGRDAKAVTEIANAAVRAYMRIEGGTEATSEDERLRTLERERDAQSVKLRQLYEAEYQLGEEFGATDLSSRENVMLARVQALQEKLTGVETQKLILEMQMATLKGRGSQGPSASELALAKSQAVRNDPVVSYLERRVVEMEDAYLLESSKRTGVSSEMTSLKQQIENNKGALEMARKKAEADFVELMTQVKASQTENALKEGEIQLQVVQAQEKMIHDELDKQNATVIALGRKGLALKKLRDEIELARDYYQRLTERIQVVQVERQRPARVSVAFQAEVPKEPYNDKRVKFSIVLGIGAALFGCAFVFFLQEIDPRVETPAEVEARIGVRPLGTIPRFEDLDKARVKPKHFVDDCRTIRVNLMLAAGEKQARVLVIASPQGRDGKTTLAINLATSIALTGKRVLLIDGDVRKPEVARYLRVNNSKGLSNVLAGECDFEEAVQPTMLATLSVLPSNRKAYRQNEMVARSSLAEVLAKARATFDEIIIDTPAVLAMPDAKLWATMADGVILVARSGKTSAKDLVEAKTRIQQAGARILGVVLTGVRISDSYEKYQHRYGEGYVDEPVSEDDWNATRVFLLSRQLAEGDGEPGGQVAEGGEKREEAS